mmetsp:Transcript_25170/g.69187  ORF Transcript_25170/g.69187 Transcript_25170/m.69187 type:complete len:111 (-) Transcript_25170:195-527(-)
MEFDVAVKSEDGKQPHGMEFAMKPKGSALVVNHVGEGPVKVWNGANPDQEVRAGDRITAVNGKKGKVADLQKKMKAAKFHMTVARPATLEPEASGREASEAKKADVDGEE